MISKSFRFGLNTANSFTNAPVRSFGVTKDYYDVLGISRAAKIDEIKEAYRRLAKEHHPDISISGEGKEGAAQKFRDIVEAYQVLSQPESRTAYDVSNKQDSDSIYRAQRMEVHRQYNERGRDGNIKKPAHDPNSYAEERTKILAEQRKLYNVDSLGRYKGGVPKKNNFLGARGKSLNEVGSFHDPEIAQALHDPFPSEQFVTSQDARAFRYYQSEDRELHTRRWSYFPAKVDYEYFQFKDYKIFFKYFKYTLVLLFGMGCLHRIFNRYLGQMEINNILELAQSQDIRKGIKVEDGRVAKLTERGVLKYI